MISRTAQAVVDLPQPRASKGAALTLLVLKLRTFIALILVVAFFSVLAPNFLSLGNVIIMSKHVAINAFLAIGMTFVILTGGIDLSVGSIVAWWAWSPAGSSSTASRSPCLAW